GCCLKNMGQISIIEAFIFLFLISGCTLSVATKYPEKQSTKKKTASSKQVISKPSQPQGVWHTVKKGENLYRISLYYEVSQQDIKKANNIDSDSLFVGQKLFIPGTNKKAPIFALTPDFSQPRAESKVVEQPVPETKIIREPEYAWPVEGKIICTYGELGNKGIDILTTPSSPVKAAKDGKVVFVGTTTKYGETIIIEHENEMFSVYGHDLIVKVKQGQTVKKGSIIGEMKNTTQARRYLHFEIRHKNDPVNPLNLLEMK
ncbi:MAG: peptidoglycan DD-metalloendopeptidase family protein, partial [Candidatus Ratteibacteria bacterium]